MIYQHHMQSTANTDLAKEQCDNLVAREQNIQVDVVSFANTRCMKECQHQNRKSNDACKKNSCEKKQSKAAFQADEEFVC